MSLASGDGATRTLRLSIEGPGITEKLQYGNAWLSKAESAYGRAKKACEFESANKDTDAAWEWRKIFGSQYEF